MFGGWLYGCPFFISTKKIFYYLYLFIKVLYICLNDKTKRHGNNLFSNEKRNR